VFIYRCSYIPLGNGLGEVSLYLRTLECNDCNMDAVENCCAVTKFLYVSAVWCMSTLNLVNSRCSFP